MTKMFNKDYEELADEKIKEMFPMGYCVGGNYEGYKRAIIEGIKIGASYMGGYEMKLEVKKDRLKINKIIENCLPLMIKNKNLTQECADCIVLYFIEKLEPSSPKTKETK